MSTLTHHCSVAIVGGGCSGLLVAVQLYRSGFKDRVTIIEPRERLGDGLAYSTPFEQHLLNVPAGKMSALPERPVDFLEWARRVYLSHATADWFAPRKLYGEYLRDLLQRSYPDGSTFTHLRAEAVAAASDVKGGRVELNDGTTVLAEKVVLALGNPASCLPPGASREGLEHCWPLSPWFEDVLRVRFAGERVLLLGAGLTAVDAALALQSQELSCNIYMVSRRGLLPQVHDLTAPVIMAPPLQHQGNLRILLRELRANVKTVRKSGGCWRAIVDTLRPVSNEIWQQLPLADKQRFQRHLKAFWEPHRHRMAPAVRAQLDGYLSRGQVQIVVGRMRGAVAHDRGLDVRIGLKDGRELALSVDRIISCTGINEDYFNSPRPLIRSIMKSGMACANDLGTGFRTDLHGALLDANRIPSSVFFTLGPPRRGDLFETTAVPEIRVQAKALALHLVARGPSFEHIRCPVDASRAQPCWQRRNGVAHWASSRSIGSSAQRSLPNNHLE